MVLTNENVTEFEARLLIYCPDLYKYYALAQYEKDVLNNHLP